jgi:outer membrane protein assembly factor BamB
MKIFFLILILLATACCKEDNPPFQLDSEGVVIGLPFNWSYKLNSISTSTSYGYIYNSIVYNKNLIITTTNNDNTRFLTLVNSNNGNKIWDWNDIFENTSGNDFQVMRSYVYENLMTWQVGGRCYCINLIDGTTQWKHQRSTSFHPKVSGVGNQYFTKSISNLYPGLEIELGYKGNLLNGNIELFLIPNFSFSHSIAGRCCDVTEMVPYEINGVQHLAVVYQELTSSEIWNFQSYLGLYNLETNDWVYERKIMNEPNLYGVSLAPPVIFNNRFYANIGHELVCHDLSTGERVWKREFEQDFMFSGFIIEDGRLIANCEDTYTYRLDPNTGATIWRTKGAGTCSRMSYLNGVAYFVGGSTGFLHAVDTENGQVLWRIDASRFESAQASFTTNAVYCIPGEGGAKGRVVALTGMYAYCFEAAR